MKTAVEWLVYQLKQQGFLYDLDIEAAKKIEKKQIIKAHIDGFDHIVAGFKKQEFAEQYYNETYNQNKS
jgi:hypothetical protein